MVGKFYRITKILIVTVLVFGIGACSKKQHFRKTVKISEGLFAGTVTVEKIEKLGKYRISILNTKTGARDQIFTPYEIFDMQTGDINGDKKPDICIGIIKPTPFDPVLKKRFYIFQIDNDYIRPLWLSSRLVHPFEEFRICSSKTEETIKTVEKRSANLFCINQYRWESFGLTYIKTISDSLSYTEAHAQLTNCSEIH